MFDKEKVIEGLEFTKAMITFNPSTGEDIEPVSLNEEDKTTYDACVGAISLLKEQEAVKPKIDAFGHPYCPKCKILVYETWKFCPHCGQEMKWNELEG